MSNFRGVEKDIAVNQLFKLPPEDVISDSGHCDGLNISAMLHKQPSSVDECLRPATAQHQLVLYCGETEHGEVSFNQEPWRKYTKRNNEWYIAPAGRNGSAWRWGKKSFSSKESLIYRILLPVSSLEEEAQGIDGRNTTVTLIPRMGVVDDLMLKLALQLQEEMASPSILGSLYTDAIASLLSLHVLKNYSELIVSKVRSGGVFSSARKATLRDFIMANLHMPIYLDQMAALVSLSKFHFSRVFKNTFGMPPYKYIFSARMNLFEQLLVNTDEPLYLLAEKAGFGHSNNVIRAFRRFNGITPSEYRRRIKSILD
ncbi:MULTISPECIES: AraC family transcriptional regulator [unclassified Serratia (in: enterobacteria)]|uniref:helix-turn-helix domain-containing protein n=1 Tax=unclassified Serratia (in: enterobacteria) TaxID=2647522 RepID=UPI0018AC0C5A|nr:MULTISPECIES: AraC family transcriptional regulator [unclassified Serratia (in: enterobacteria)]